MVYVGEYKDFLSAQKKEQLERNYKIEEYGDRILKIMIEEGEAFCDYQFINKDAKEFAQTILFEIVKRNYDSTDSYDEETFMSNYNIIGNASINERGRAFLDDHDVEIYYMMNKLKIIKEKIEKLDSSDITTIDSKDLFFMVYPNVIKDCDNRLVVKCFNEIMKRIYGNNICITCSKKELRVNDNIYEIEDISNLFNIVLYECLNDMDLSLRKDREFIEGLNGESVDNAIKLYKKKWLCAVIFEIDKNNNEEIFGILKYQSVYRLLNKEGLEKIITNTSGNYFPLRKRGVR
jgi:hypothetical protein